MAVTISSAALATIRAHAAGSRDEVCGLLFGSHDNVTAARACANVHPHPARFFEIDPAALIAAHRAGRAGGPAVIGHYHSHPSGRAEPSPRDAAAASADGALWLIAAGEEVRAWHAVRDGTVHGRFEPVVLVACAPRGEPPEGAHPAC